MNGAMILKSSMGVVAGVCAYVFGLWEAHVVVLVIMVSIDYITGIISAGMQGKLSSKEGFFGLLKKLVIFLLIAVGTGLDRIIPATNGALRSAIIIFYIVNEALSILENAGEIGLPLPPFLKSAIEKLNVNFIGKKDTALDNPEKDNQNDDTQAK